MKDELFTELLVSIREGGRILRGEEKPDEVLKRAMRAGVGMG